jgi:acetolactate decarboxylase
MAPGGLLQFGFMPGRRFKTSFVLAQGIPQLLRARFRADGRYSGRCLATMVYYNSLIFVAFLGFMAVGYATWRACAGLCFAATPPEVESMSRPAADSPPIYLCSPVNALVEGVYEARIPLRELLAHGDFGLGTFDQLDGEMVILDGRIFQIDGEGRVTEMSDSAHTPFACVTRWTPVSTEEINGEMAWAEFSAVLQAMMPSPNLFYAIRIEGEFAAVDARSVPRQDSYRPLVEVARDQKELHFANLRGTLAGFHTPAFMGSVNVPGIHLHFLSEDRSCGGHLMACAPRNVRVGIQYIHRLELALPITLDYLTLEFKRDTAKDLEEAE